MEAGSIRVPGGVESGVGRLRRAAGDHPALVTLLILLAVAVILTTTDGINLFAQRSVNGLVAGSYFALGAIGLTLVYGILKLVNFAHGDMLTFGAYIAFLFNVTIGIPLIFALAVAIVTTAAVGVLLELAMWRPMRRRGAGMLQLLLMAIGLAFVIRNSIQLVAGTSPRTLDVNVTDSIEFVGLSIGRTELIVLVTALFVLTAVALMLRYTTLGRQMRALSDNFELAETTGIDTGRIVLYTWILAGGLAGLAGVMVVASLGSLTPNTGFGILLAMFAAVVMGGIGNAYGALAGGLVLGLTQEWATLVFEARWKIAVSFVILILVLVVRPQGIFGRARTL